LVSRRGALLGGKPQRKCLKWGAFFPSLSYSSFIETPSTFSADWVRRAGEIMATPPKKKASRASSQSSSAAKKKKPANGAEAFELLDKQLRVDMLIDEAMDATTPERYLHLLSEGLKIDPENVDLLLMIADATAMDIQERISILQSIVFLAAGQLGEENFKSYIPHFWGFHETRPFMRALEALAQAFVEAGMHEEAIREYSEMLLLNENDNQGVRYELLPLLLIESRLEEADQLIQRYVDDCEFSVVFTWCAVLERLLAGDEAAAVEKIWIARKQNPHMEDYLSGKLKLPKRFPDMYSPGSKEEARCYAIQVSAAWTAHPEAHQWLKEQLRRLKSMKSRAPKGKKDASKDG
jgi:tetratricopeptide (TPR) repeat protein